MGFDPVSYAMGKQAGGGGGGVTVEPLPVTENGVYTAPSGKAFSPVTVNVFQMQSYTTTIYGAFYPGSDSAVIAQMSFPKKIALDLPQCMAIDNAFRQYIERGEYRSGIEEVELRLYNPCSVSNFCNRNTTIKKVSFSNGLTINSTISGFIASASLEEVDGAITILPGITNSANAFLASALKSITFTQNTLYFPNLEFASPYLNDATLVSIANGLDGTVSGATLTHHATAKTRCGQIVGTVTDGVFSIDAGGTVTLTDFITQTKGWTLA